MRILIVKLTGLRGALATSASLRALKEVIPGAAVTYLTLPCAQPATEGCPLIIETVGYDSDSSWSDFLGLLGHLRRQKFDFALALSPQPLARLLVALSGARQRVCAGRAPFYLRHFFHQQVTDLLVDPHEAAQDFAVISQAFHLFSEVPRMWFASSRMNEHGLLVEPQKYCVIHPGAARREQILEIDKWVVVAKELVASGMVERVVVSAGQGSEERLMAEALCGLIGPVAQSTQGRLSFSQLAKLIQDARLFLGTDSAILQLASAVRTPVVGVYGPSDYNRTRPWGTLSRVVRIDTTSFEGEDRADYLARLDRAMARITPQQIIRAADEVVRLSHP